MDHNEPIPLAKDFWNSASIEADGRLPCIEEISELNRRLAEDDATPEDTVAWKTIKAEAQERWQPD